MGLVALFLASRLESWHAALGVHLLCFVSRCAYFGLEIEIFPIVSTDTSFSSSGTSFGFARLRVSVRTCHSRSASLPAILMVVLQ